jgi:soluble lytic murein transglycosylase-like protein
MPGQWCRKGLIQGTTRARALSDCYPALIARESRRSGIGAHVLSALVWRESRCDPQAVGRRGELGLGQVMPGTRAARGYTSADLLRPGPNLRATARHLRWCLALCGDLAGALGVYSGRRTCRAGRDSGYARAVLELAGREVSPAENFTDNPRPTVGENGAVVGR